MVAVAQRQSVAPAFSRRSQFASFLSVASSVLGGAILQVFLSPPEVVFADVAANPAAFAGWCLALQSCTAWQRAWQLSCVVAFCFVILSITACATSAVAHTSSLSLAAAIVFFLASFMATAVTVLAIVFLSFSKATCIATSAMLIGLLVFSTLLSWDGLVMGLEDIVLGPRLWRAASRGDVAAVRRYLWTGANPNWGGLIPERPPSRDGRPSYFLSNSGPIQGVTPLHIAACSGHFDVVRQLLLHPDVKISAVDSQGSTALHLAAANLDSGMVSLLTKHDPRPDCWASNKGGWTPLLAAMEARVPAKPLHRACRTAKEMWQQHIAEVDFDIAEDADRRIRKKVVKQLLCYRGGGGIDAISPGNQLTALQLAIKRQWSSITDLLIKAGASADVVGTSQTTLGLACITPGEEDAKIGGDMAERLINAGASVDWQGEGGQSALHVCLEYLQAAAWAEAERDRYLHIIESAMVLLSSGADAGLRNSDTETPLMLAVGVPQPLGAELTTMLLFFAHDLEASDDIGQTALKHAIEAENIAAVSLLLAAGANPNPQLPRVMAMTKKLLTPLQLAADKDAIEIGRLLINHGADVNLFAEVLLTEMSLRTLAQRLEVEDFDPFGHIYPKMPPLMHAICGDHPEMVQLLLDNGAHINETGTSGFPSPLFFAAQKCGGDIIRLLRAAGLAPDQHDEEGLTPADYAREAENDDALHALDDNGDSSWSTMSSDGMAGESQTEGGTEGSSGPGTPPAPAAQPQLPNLPPEQHQAINISNEQQPQQRGFSAPRLSLFARLAQVTTRLVPFRRYSSGSTTALSPQLSRGHEAMPRIPSFSGSSSASSDSSTE